MQAILPDVKGLKDNARRGLSFSRAVTREFVTDQCAPRAAGLAFASLIALVPMSALLFSLFSALGTFTDLVASIQDGLVQLLIPTR